MCDPVSGTIAASAILGAGTSIYQGEQQKKQAKKSRRQNAARAEEEATRQDREYNRLNKRNPNVGQALANNTNAAKSGVGSTMLTGPGGIGSNALNLSNNTLLGG